MTTQTLSASTIDVTKLQTHLDQLVTKLQDSLGSNLVNVTLYGSCVTALTEHSAGLSQTHPHNINVFVCIKHHGADVVGALGKVMQWWQPIALCLPIVLTQQEWERSQDVFAIEYADMASQSQCIFGSPMFSNFQSDRQALRLLCELELHKKCLTVRQQITLHYHEPEQLMALMSRTISSVIAVGRNVVRLLDTKQPIPSNPLALLQTLNETLSPSGAESLKAVWKLAQEPRKQPSLNDLQTLAIDYINDLTLMRDMMDRLHIE